MTEIKGKYNTAVVYTDNLEDEAYKQILGMMNQIWCKDLKVRIMPDVHAGAGCTIGTTMTIKDKICPNLVGVDIGCGVDVIVIKSDCGKVDLSKLDTLVHEKIPSGKNHRQTPHNYADKINFKDFIAPVSENAALSIGTLGGGNHFIEVDKDEAGNFYIVVHSGSRHLGIEICNYYQKIAIKEMHNHTKEHAEIIAKLKAEGRQKEIENIISKLKGENCPDELAYIEGENFEHYIHDMELAQKYAVFNRKAMLNVITECLGISSDEIIESFSSIHNYIDTENMILRKGSVSAQKGEKLIIPMNMRDGSLICIGKGNPDWNFSAPHGAGRLMSRKAAKESLKLEDFKTCMDGIYTTCVSTSTIDEAPMAYKSASEIIENVKGSVDIINIVKPIYNFKAAE